jgi:FKBP-type peptidyl-prolyl cis-trans isomerase
MRSFLVLLGFGVVLLTIAIVVRSGKLMRENPGEPLNAAMRQALAGKAYQWPEADVMFIAQRHPGAADTPNGARYVVLQPGAGEAAPQPGQQVTVNYTARLLSNDRKLDASADHGGPYNFVVGQPNILPGWTDALHRMKKGERRLVFLPYWLAYGEKGSKRGNIPPRSSVALEVELVDFK